MEPIEIGIAVSIGLLVFVILGMRVAFAAPIETGERHCSVADTILLP